MVLAAICAIVCFAIVVRKDDILIAIISLCSSFIPIIVWFVDSRDNEKTIKELKKKVDGVEDCLTIKVL